MELSAQIRLRPTRIGFLARPTDLAAVRKVMRASACLWGGVYNPIIPVFRTAPKEWRDEFPSHPRGAAVAKGYVRFFEPDVYVEAEEGLLEEAGLGNFRLKHTIHPLVTTLDDFFESRREREWGEPAFGLNVNDVLADVY